MKFKYGRVAKYGLAGLAVALWATGLVDQTHSWQSTMQYLAISAAMVAIATL